MERLFNGERIKCVQPVEEGFDQYEVRILTHNLNNFLHIVYAVFHCLRSLFAVYAQFHDAARICMLFEHYRKVEALLSLRFGGCRLDFVDFIQILGELRFGALYFCLLGGFCVSRAR